MDPWCAKLGNVACRNFNKIPFSRSHGPPLGTPSALPVHRALGAADAAAAVGGLHHAPSTAADRPRADGYGVSTVDLGWGTVVRWIHKVLALTVIGGR